MTDLTTILATAKAAAHAKALAIWERDGKIDCGTCGGAVFLLKKNTKLAKAAIAGGYAHGDDSPSIKYDALVPEGVRSQNADIQQDAARAFKKVIEDAGLGFAIKKFWTYVD